MGQRYVDSRVYWQLIMADVDRTQPASAVAVAVAVLLFSSLGILGSTGLLVTRLALL